MSVFHGLSAGKARHEPSIAAAAGSAGGELAAGVGVTLGATLGTLVEEPPILPPPPPQPAKKSEPAIAERKRPALGFARCDIPTGLRRGLPHAPPPTGNSEGRHTRDSASRRSILTRFSRRRATRVLKWTLTARYHICPMEIVK